MENFSCDLLEYENRCKCTSKRLQNVTFTTHVPSKLGLNWSWDKVSFLPE